MTQIVQIMPSKKRPILNLAMGAVFAFAAAAVLDVVLPGPLTHEESRQEVFDAYQGYPPIDEARQVRVVGRDCGPERKELLVRESAQHDVQWIMDNCLGIDVEAM